MTTPRLSNGVWYLEVSKKGPAGKALSIRSSCAGGGMVFDLLIVARVRRALRPLAFEALSGLISLRPADLCYSFQCASLGAC